MDGAITYAAQHGMSLECLWFAFFRAGRKRSDVAYLFSRIPSANLPQNSATPYFSLQVMLGLYKKLGFYRFPYDSG